jgi:hypothetical protein
LRSRRHRSRYLLAGASHGIGQKTTPTCSRPAQKPDGRADAACRKTCPDNALPGSTSAAYLPRFRASRPRLVASGIVQPLGR